MSDEAPRGGEWLNDTTHCTDFRRASEVAAEVVTIYRYDSRETLAALGIIRPAPRYGRGWQPQSFPAGFVPDPRG